MLANRFIRFLFVAVLSVIALLIVGIVAAPDKATARYNFEQIRGSQFGRSYERALAYEKLEGLRSSRYAASSKTQDLAEQIPGSGLGPSYTLYIRATGDRSTDRREELRSSRYDAASSVGSAMERIEELRVQRSVDAAYGGWYEKIEELRLDRDPK